MPQVGQRFHAYIHASCRVNVRNDLVFAGVEESVRTVSGSVLMSDDEHDMGRSAAELNDEGYAERVHTTYDDFAGRARALRSPGLARRRGCVISPDAA